MTVTLLLGSNLGNRARYLESARRLLSVKLGPELSATPVVETASEGFTGPDFLNQIVRFETTLAPEELLKFCKRIERNLGRKDSPEYAADGTRIYHNRVIDIDILYYGSLEINTDTLTIPHPQVKTRPFVEKLLNL